MLRIARLRTESGTFAPGPLFTDEERKEKNRIRQAEWTRKNPEKRRAIAARDRAAHRERIFRHNHEDPRRSRRWRRQNAEKQLGRPCPSVCEIPGCGNTGAIHFDHDHATGKARGWLCFNCNAALGHVKDRQHILRALADYLERNR